MNERLKVYEDKMKKTQANLEGELMTIRAGRANPERAQQDHGRLLRISYRRSSRWPTYPCRSPA